MEPPKTSVPGREWPRDLKYAIEERGDEDGLIVQRDSTILSRSITKDQTKKGVIFTDLGTALRLSIRRLSADTLPSWSNPMNFSRRSAPHFGVAAPFSMCPSMFKSSFPFIPATG